MKLKKFLSALILLATLFVAGALAKSKARKADQPATAT